MWISSKGFELAAWNLLVLGPKAGIVGIMLGTEVWYQRSEPKPVQRVGGPFCPAPVLEPQFQQNCKLETLSLVLCHASSSVPGFSFCFFFFALSDLVLDSTCEKELSSFLGAEPSLWHLRNGFTEEWWEVLKMMIILEVCWALVSLLLCCFGLLSNLHDCPI